MDRPWCAPIRMHRATWRPERGGEALSSGGCKTAHARLRRFQRHHARTAAAVPAAIWRRPANHAAASAGALARSGNQRRVQARSARTGVHLRARAPLTRNCLHARRSAFRSAARSSVAHSRRSIPTAPTTNRCCGTTMIRPRWPSLTCSPGPTTPLPARPAPDRWRRRMMPPPGRRPMQRPKLPASRPPPPGTKAPFSFPPTAMPTPPTAAWAIRKTRSRNQASGPARRQPPRRVRK